MIIAIVIVSAVILVIIVGLVIAKQMQSSAWKELASELGGKFVDGGFFHPGSVQTQIRDRTITLDTYSVISGEYNTIYTRIRIPAHERDSFQFTIFRTGLIGKIDKVLGSQDIEIGDTDFDRAFTIQSNNELRVRALLTNPRIRGLIQRQKSIRLVLRNNELYFEAQGIIKDAERLKLLFDLFKEILGQLEG